MLGVPHEQASFHGSGPGVPDAAVTEAGLDQIEKALRVTKAGKRALERQERFLLGALGEPDEPLASLPLALALLAPKADALFVGGIFGSEGIIGVVGHRWIIPPRPTCP